MKEEQRAAGFGSSLISCTALGISCLLCLAPTSPLQCRQLRPLGACFSPLTVKRIQITHLDGDVNTGHSHLDKEHQPGVSEHRDTFYHALGAQRRDVNS